jgi:hypothetical protein
MVRFFSVADTTATNGRTLEILHNTMVVYRNSANLPSTLPVLYNGSMPGDALTAAHQMTYAPDHGVTPSGGVTLLDQPWPILDVWMRYGWERQFFALPAAVGPGQTTPLIPYPNDWNDNPTTQASYAGTRNRHSLRPGPEPATVYHQILGGSGATLRDSITVNFEAGGFTVTNRHPSNVWPEGVVLDILLDRGTTLEDPTLVYTVDQTRKRLPRPNTAQALTADEPSTLFDFSMRNDRLRPNADFAISPTTGSNSAGALLPV